MSEQTALVIGGTGPTGPSLVNGLLAQGFTTAILHTGRHEVDTIPAHVEHIHTNPFKIDELAAAVGERTFDIVYSMYGRLRDIAPWFVGKTGKFVAVGGMPSYLGYAVPGLLNPPGLRVPTREDAPGSDRNENEKTAKMVASEALVLPVEAHAARRAPIDRAWVNAAAMPLSLKLPEGFIPSY